MVFTFFSVRNRWLTVFNDHFEVWLIIIFRFCCAATQIQTDSNWHTWCQSWCEVWLMSKLINVSTRMQIFMCKVFCRTFKLQCVAGRNSVSWQAGVYATTTNTISYTVNDKLTQYKTIPDTLIYPHTDLWQWQACNYLLWCNMMQFWRRKKGYI